MNENVSLLNRVVLFGLSGALIAMMMWFGWSSQSLGLSVGQDAQSAIRYADIDLLAGPEVGNGGGGG